jgi:hypothetical protein
MVATQTLAKQNPAQQQPSASSSSPVLSVVRKARLVTVRTVITSQAFARCQASKSQA